MAKISIQSEVSRLNRAAELWNSTAMGKSQVALSGD